MTPEILSLIITNAYLDGAAFATKGALAIVNGETPPDYERLGEAAEAYASSQIKFLEGKGIYL